MKTQFKVMAGIFLAGAAVVNFAPMPGGANREEAWLKEQMPAAVDGMPKSGGYDMGKQVYETLLPFGIVSNFYKNNQEAYDVTVIASDKEQSFHDPRICFSSQGMEISNETTEIIQTKSHGPIPLTIVEVKGQAGSMIAAYTYKGPDRKMISSPIRLTNLMFLKALVTMKPQEAVFYRFISQHGNATKDELKAFATKFFEEADKSSNHYL